MYIDFSSERKCKNMITYVAPYISFSLGKM